MQSGAANNPSASVPNPKKYVIRLAANLGFKSEDPKEIVKFLKTVDHMKLTKAQELLLTGEVSKIKITYYIIYLYTLYITSF